MMSEAATPAWLRSWRVHIAMASTAQLSSRDLMLEHVKQFPTLVVSQGLAHTALDGMSDVQQLIADLSDTSNLPQADALAVVAQETCKRLAVELASEMVNLAKEKALAGETQLTVPVKSTFPSAACIESPQVESKVEAAVVKLLSDVGFKPGYNLKPGQGFFVYNWLPGCMHGERVLQLKWE